MELKNKEERIEKLFRRIRTLVNNGDIYLYLFEKLSIHLLNNYTYLKEKDNLISELFSKIHEFMNNLKSFELVFKDRFKATIVYFCLNNKLIYVNLLKKLYPKKNYSSIEFAVKELVKRGILRPVAKNEMIKEKNIFNHFILRNSPNAGYHHIHNVKYYTLTEEALWFFSSFKEPLSKVADEELVEKYKFILAKTHKELERLAERKEDGLKKCINILFGEKNSPELKKYASVWSERILPKYGIYLSPDVLEKAVNTASSQLDALQMVKEVVERA